MKLDYRQIIMKSQFLFVLFSILELTKCEKLQLNIYKSEKKIINSSSYQSSFYETFKYSSFNLFDENKANITINSLIDFNVETKPKICKSLFERLIYNNSENLNNLIDYNSKNENKVLSFESLKENTSFDEHLISENDFKCLLKLKELKNIINDEEIFKKSVISLKTLSDNKSSYRFKIKKKSSKNYSPFFI